MRVSAYQVGPVPGRERLGAMLAERLGVARARGRVPGPAVVAGDAARAGSTPVGQ